MYSLKHTLSKANPFFFNLFAIISAFGLYTSMYAFRKPFTSITFENEAPIFDVDYKILLVIAQVIGYTLSKFLGIKYISEVLKDRRALSIILLIAIAEISLLFFGIVEHPMLRIVFLFFNGLPLGMIWGLVFNYLEGRKYTDLLGAGLSVSFIFASGFVKSIGKWLVDDLAINDYWMPFWVGAIFIIPILVFVWMLEQIPPPNEEDITLRTERKPMFKEDRKEFLKRYFPAVLLSAVVYISLTIIRTIRDDFATDIWQALGITDSAIFTQSETPITIFILILVGSMFLIKDSRKALMINLLLVTIGLATIVISTMLFSLELISSIFWMVTVGTGLYMGYVPFNCIIFERMIAAFKFSGTAGFLIYVVDAWGYLANIGVLLYKNFQNPSANWKDVFVSYCIYIGLFALVLSVLSMVYFYLKLYKSKEGILINNMQKA